MIKVKFLDNLQREEIGFSFVMDRLEIMTPFGLEERNNIRPFKKEEKHKLLLELNNIELIMKEILKNKELLLEIERAFCRVKDIRNTVKRCKEKVTLGDVELYEVKYFSILIEEIMYAYKKFNLDIEGIKINSLAEAVNILDPENKKIPTFYIYDCYSDKLRAVRAEKRKLEEMIFKSLSNEEMIRLKDERLNIVIQEEEEELSIRKELTERLSQYALQIEDNIKVIGRLDFLIAKGKLAAKYKGSKPEIVNSIYLNLKDMFNPEIAELLEGKGKQFTPVSLELKSGSTIITGANMGGKSVALKTIVLNLLLSQCGFFVFAEKAELPILDFIYLISDDMQSVSKGLSTFGAEVVRLKEIIEAARSETGFIALDEFARGTNPKEGSYLVKALGRYLNTYNSISLISTHYDGIVEADMVHYQAAGLKNVDFEMLKQKIGLDKMNSISIIQEHMEYKLERVCEESDVPKDALNISLLLGLQSEIIDIAREYYNSGD